MEGGTNMLDELESGTKLLGVLDGGATTLGVVDTCTKLDDGVIVVLNIMVEEGLEETELQSPYSIWHPGPQKSSVLPQRFSSLQHSPNPLP